MDSDADRSDEKMAKLVIVSGDLRGREFDLVDDQTIGRLSENEIPVPESTISRRHARVYRGPRGWTVEDVGSSTGIRSEDGRVEELGLEDGMRFYLGAIEFMFLNEEGEPIARTGEFGRPSAQAARPERSPMPPSSGASRTGEFGADAIELRGSGVSKVAEKRLQYSENVGKKASVLGGDLSQESGLGRWLMILGVLAFIVGLFWLTQTLVAGG
jgi:pSer/pThr/pTyr-binding forkhead associated (FHA) protein